MGRKGDEAYNRRERDREGRASTDPRRDGRVCYAHQREECRRGASCRYLHQSSPMTSGHQESPNQPSEAQDSKLTNSTQEGDECSVGKDIIGCPRQLHRSRDYLFRGISTYQRKDIAMDTVASYSVTESHMADRMTSIILEHAEGIRPSAEHSILDGMACVGGNTISFAHSFKTVLANEYDKSRYDMLCHNVRNVMNINNVQCFNESITDLATTANYDILFLDPEWGGPDYKFKENLRLTIADIGVESFCTKVMNDCPKVHTIALKLPVNYDNEYLQQTADENGLSYILFTNFRKMTLTIIQRKQS